MKNIDILRSEYSKAKDEWYSKKYPLQREIKEEEDRLSKIYTDYRDSINQDFLSEDEAYDYVLKDTGNEKLANKIKESYSRGETKRWYRVDGSKLPTIKEERKQRNEFLYKLQLLDE